MAPCPIMTRQRPPGRPSYSSWLALVLFVALFLFPTLAHAQQMVLELDSARTQVQFTLDAFLHTVHGTIKLDQGKISIDPATGRTSGLLVVDARSASTGNSGRDDKMHQDILQSPQYPRITFTPIEIQGPIAPQGKSLAQLRGIISLHGKEQEIITPVSVEIDGSEWNAETSFPVPYVKWGLKNPSTFFLRVKDTVIVTVHAAGKISLTEPQP
jgi:polyisoprenoid-binding protein YceI